MLWCHGNPFRVLFWKATVRYGLRDVFNKLESS